MKCKIYFFGFFDLLYLILCNGVISGNDTGIFIMISSPPHFVSFFCNIFYFVSNVSDVSNVMDNRVEIMMEVEEVLTEI